MNTERLTFEEACRELGVTEEELEQLVAAGEISSMKEGDTLYFKKDVVRKFKKSREGSASILLSDEEIDLLEEEPTEEADLVGAKSAEAPPKQEGRIEIPLDDDLALPDIEIRAPKEDTEDLESAGAKAEKNAGLADEETLLNLDGVLEEDTEATTPVPGGAASVEDDSTLLDTEMLDLGAQADPFASDTVEETAESDLTEPGTLLRGGGARVMQMKRKTSHAGWTVVLAASAILLLLPLGIVTNLLFTQSSETKNLQPAKESYTWIMDYNVLGGLVESVADIFRSK